MKKIIQIVIIAFIGFTIQAQENVSLTMESGYANRVFYKLSDGTVNSYVNNDWDIAFYRASNYGFATRINDGKGITVYEASNNPADWEAIEVSGSGSWTTLYNSDTDWLQGAFDNGSAAYGWGEYNPVTHHVEGTVIFVLQYADGTYRKFFIDDFYGGYTFNYSTWNGTTWSATQTHTLSNSTNPDQLFNYYSLANNAEVIAEPATDTWDLVFTKYITDLGGNVMYQVTGVLHHPSVTVAEHDETTGAPYLQDLIFMEEINTIGYDWKTFNGTSFEVDSDTGYYVNTGSDNLYKVIFTNFEGSSTGNIGFTVTDLENLSTGELDAVGSFLLYPNPTTNKQVSIMLNANISAKAGIGIYNIMGKKVYETILENGTTRTNLSLHDLSAGVYFVKIEVGAHSGTKKLIIR